MRLMSWTWWVQRCRWHRAQLLVVPLVRRSHGVQWFKARLSHLGALPWLSNNLDLNLQHSLSNFYELHWPYGFWYFLCECLRFLGVRYFERREEVTFLSVVRATVHVQHCLGWRRLTLFTWGWIIIFAFVLTLLRTGPLSCRPLVKLSSCVYTNP